MPHFKAGTQLVLPQSPTMRSLVRWHRQEHWPGEGSAGSYPSFHQHIQENRLRGPANLLQMAHERHIRGQVRVGYSGRENARVFSSMVWKAVSEKRMKIRNPHENGKLAKAHTPPASRWPVTDQCRTSSVVDLAGTLPASAVPTAALTRLVAIAAKYRTIATRLKRYSSRLTAAGADHRGALRRNRPVA